MNNAQVFVKSEAMPTQKYWFMLRIFIPRLAWVFLRAHCIKGVSKSAPRIRGVFIEEPK